MCHEAEVEVTGGQTVLNPWPIIGGTAMAVCAQNEFIAPVHAQIGASFFFMFIYQFILHVYAGGHIS